MATPKTVLITGASSGIGAATAVAAAEAGYDVAIGYFRDKEGQDVLIFIDNIFRFTQAGSEVSALLGRIPSAVGYQPTLSTDLGDYAFTFDTEVPGALGTGVNTFASPSVGLVLLGRS